ncbi:hypothetical protein P7C73_g4610, partial [Tremellales sp. Uapishka_1]
MPRLLGKYPLVIDNAPTAHKAKDGEYTVLHLAVALQAMVKFENKPFRICAHHPEAKFTDTQVARAHLLEYHGYWCPPKIGITTPLAKKAKAGEFSQEIARFPSPPYYTHGGKYHPHPLEAITFCKALLEERNYDPAALSAGYGLPEDIDIPDTEFTSYRSNGLPLDNKYPLVSGA